SLSKSGNGKFCSVVSASVSKKIGPGQTGNGDIVPFRFLQFFYRCFQRMKDAGDIGIHHGVPVFQAQLIYRSKYSETGIGNYTIQSSEPAYNFLYGMLLITKVTNI